MRTTLYPGNDAAPDDPGARLKGAAALSEGCERLSPYKRERFTKSFDSFADYAGWKDAQTNPWNR